MTFTLFPQLIFAKASDASTEPSLSDFVLDENNGSLENEEEQTEYSTAKGSNLLRASQKDASVGIIASDDERLSEKYLSMYSIPSSFFSAENNGGEFGSNLFKYVFDRNWNTTWRSQSEQVGGFTNTVDVTFKEKVSLDRFLYRSDSGARGYPTTLKLSFANGTDEYTRQLTIASSATGDTVLFEFGETYECTKIQLEWLSCPTYHRYEASAREIIFLQPETEEAESSNALFTDYNWFTLKDEYNSKEALDSLDESLKENINYSSYFAPIIQRAKDVLSGKLQYSAESEFSTIPKSDGVTKIKQNGALRSYAQNTLRLAWFGIDRQTTGLYAKTGDVLKVYVGADENETSLPTLSLSQHYGTAGSWKRDYNLKKGLNLITVPDFGASSSTNPAVAGGGPIYISNPYTAKEQGEVKVYIEGAESFPVYRKLPEESSREEKISAVEAFLEKLSAYCENGFTPGEYPFDLVELQSDHCLMTLKASLAKNMYITSGASDKLRAQDNLENYDAYMERLLAFEGITLNKSDKYYDEKNEYLSINFRASQATGVLAYATFERVGVLNDSWQNSLLYATGIGRGWGLTHEIGHTLDMHYDRAKHELTNNMLSKYNETALGGGDGTRGYFNDDLANLSSDRTDYTRSSYLNSNMYNYCIWWHLESYMPGYWGNLANMFRYYTSECDSAERDLINTLGNDEKQVYYSSLILGIDLGYYYERYGFKIYGSSQFTESGATENFKTLMSNAAADGRIDNKTKPRFWYLDENQYNIVANSNGVESLEKAFLPNEQTQIKTIEKTSGGYSIVLPAIKDKTTLLGYEIYEGQSEETATIIGFSKTGVFIDTTEYDEGYEPKYWVKAFNRDLSSSAISEPKQLSQSGVVCSLNQNEFTSLKAAVEAASDGDTIVLLSNLTETGIVIDKNLTIEVKDGLNVTHSRGSSGSVFAVGSGCTLTVNGDNRLTFDGNSILQNAAFFNLGNTATLNLNGVKIQNAFSSSNGGAISLGSATLNVSGCTFENNSASNGAAIAATAAQGRIKIDSSSFKNGNAAQTGGAIYSVATLEIKQSAFENNTAQNGGAIGNAGGGILRLNTNNRFESNSASNGGALWLDGFTTVSNANFVSNSAKQNGGAVYYSTSVNTRAVTITLSVFENNSSKNLGSEIYASINNSVPKLTLESNTMQTSPCLESGVYLEKGTAVLNDGSLLSIGTSAAKAVSLSQNSGNVTLTSDGGWTLVLQNASLDSTETFPTVQIGNNSRILGKTIQTSSGGALEIESVSSFGHTESELIIDLEPSCTKDGKAHKECTVCGKILESSVLEKTKHTKSDWITDRSATCTAEGSKHIECTVCKAVLQTASIEKTEHVPTSWITDSEPSCTQDGSRHKECSVCKTVLETQALAAKGHKDSDSDGYCDLCGEQLKTVSCSCLCHSSNGFVKFVWKILCFFYRIFGSNKVCACGALHY